MLGGCARGEDRPDAPRTDAADAGRDIVSRVDGCTVTCPEDTAEACADGIDNDCDGYVDCNDFTCSRSLTVTVCARDG